MTRYPVAMPYATGSLARYTRVQPLRDVDFGVDVDVVSLLAQPEVADRVSRRLTKYFAKILGAAVGTAGDVHVSPLEPIATLRQDLGRLSRCAVAPSGKSIAIDFSAHSADVDVLPVLVDLDERGWLAGPDALHQNLYRSLPRKLSRAERDLTETETLERLRGNTARRSVISASVDVGKTLIFVVDHVASEARAEFARLWERLDIGRMLARHAEITILRALGIPSQKIFQVEQVSSEAVRSIESHRSRAPGRSRTSIDLVRWEPLTV